MSDKKCFCHLNGYEVKDATARNQIENLTLTVTNNKAACEQSAAAATEAKTLATEANNTANRVAENLAQYTSDLGDVDLKASNALNAANEANTNLSALAARVGALENTETEYVTEMALEYDSSTESLTIGTEVKTYE